MAVMDVTPSLDQTLSCARHRDLGSGRDAAALAVVLVERHRQRDCPSCGLGHLYGVWLCAVSGRRHLHTGHQRGHADG